MQWAGPSQSAARLDAAMAGDLAHAERRWEQCGGQRLTGRADGPGLKGPARVASAFDEWAAQVAELTGGTGAGVVLDGSALVGERAAIAGLRRAGAVSAGGACRLLRSADGVHVAVSMARADDVAAVDAWLEASLDLDEGGAMDDSAWRRLADALAARPAATLHERALLLGLPFAVLGERSPDTQPYAVARALPARPRSVRGATVVDLSSLWAGPLCARVLGLAGARIVKVESSRRPDGARLGPPAFYELLHRGHESVVLDLHRADGVARLRELLAGADVVIEASRPRALAAMGVSFDDLHDDGWRGVWTTITAHGAHGDAAMRVGFGDDAAVAGGLVAHDDQGPVFCADAIADPATGLLAATAVLRAVADGVTGRLELSLANTAAHLAARL